MRVLIEKICNTTFYSNFVKKGCKYDCSILSIAVVANKNKPALNAILASNLVNLTCLNGLNRNIKNRLIYIFTIFCKVTKYCGETKDIPNAIRIYNIQVT